MVKKMSKYIYFQLGTGHILNYYDPENYNYSEVYPENQLLEVSEEEWNSLNYDAVNYMVEPASSSGSVVSREYHENDFLPVIIND
jgi:hypothetical protein